MDYCNLQSDIIYRSMCNKERPIPEVDTKGMDEQEKHEANEQHKAEEKVAELIFNKEVEEFVKRKIAYKYLFF